MPDVRKNSVSGSVLINNGFKLVFEAIKFVITKNGTFLVKGYIYLCKMNINSMGNKASTFAYIIASSNVWYARLGPVNFSSIKNMMDMGLISRSEVVPKNL